MFGFCCSFVGVFVAWYNNDGIETNCFMITTINWAVVFMGGVPSAFCELT